MSEEQAAPAAPVVDDPSAGWTVHKAWDHTRFELRYTANDGRRTVEYGVGLKWFPKDAQVQILGPSRVSVGGRPMKDPCDAGPAFYGLAKCVAMMEWLDKKAREVASAKAPPKEGP